MELCVGGLYTLGKKIGSGSFGDIYLGTNVETGEEFAVKLESVRQKHPQLQYESKVYRIIEGGTGIPNIHWFGTEGDQNVLVMDLLGPSLEELHKTCNRKFSLKTVLMIADQILARIEFLHGKNFIHRDVKPDNFLISYNKKDNLIHAIDFGLAKKYIDSKTNQHIAYRENRNLTGTVRYNSVNTQMGIEQSRRDDIESLGNVLLYFLKGTLPWQGLRAPNKVARNAKIMETK